MTVLTLQKNNLNNATASAKNQVLLVSCYELGHQPAGLAMPLGFLRREGIEADTLDVSLEGFEAAKVMEAKFVGISVPMHTALRLGVAIAQEIRRLNADCHICFYGLYAALNADYLLATIADSIIGGEFEAPLVALIQSVLASRNSSPQVFPTGVKTTTAEAAPLLVRLNFAKPERDGLPALNRYARLEYGGEQRLVGYVEASRGCLHHCTHCPIPPVYEGRFFIVPVDVVLQDIRQLVAAGAAHITFGDPDFFNGPTHALRLVRAMHEEFPRLTFDCTVKVEHIIKHEDLFTELANCGCIFVVSAVESLSDKVLHHLEKGHTRADVFTALRILRAAGIALRPSLVSFTPWTTLDDFLEVLNFVESENLIDALDPVQYSIRLLVPPGSLLLQREETPSWLGQLNQPAFTYVWQHPDPRMDELHKRVAALVERAAQINEDAAVTFYRLRDLVEQRRGKETASLARAHLSASPSKPPRLTEAWFC
ncbi:MAG: radical SAM protein [Acidobacteria bacterium]|nr:radical SAM protein [Acidobacteriota bacterium]